MEVYVRRCKRIKVPRIPPEVIFNILLFIPARILYNVMRYVCKEWYNIICDPHFISAHLLHAPKALLVRDVKALNSVDLIEVNGCEITVRDEVLPMEATLYASYDGLLLLLGSNTYYVVNPVTKQVLTLPPASHQYFLHRYCVPGMGYVASIGAYKVVNFWICYVTEGELRKPCYRGEMLTIGVDTSWRRINICLDVEEHYLHACPLSIKGYVYWLCIRSCSILALDLDTESFHFFDAPKESRVCRLRYHLCMGDCLALVGKNDGPTWNIWVAREVKKAGEEWTRLQDISLESHVSLFENISFYGRHMLWLVGWLKEGELVVIRDRSRKGIFIVYNNKTGEISSVAVDHAIRFHPFTLSTHVPSLVRI